MKALAALAALESSVATFAADNTTALGEIKVKLDTAMQAITDLKAELAAAGDGPDLTPDQQAALDAANKTLGDAQAAVDDLAKTQDTPPTAPAVTVPTPEGESVPNT